MSQCDPVELEDLVELWRRRFGQPPPIVAERDMMLRILDSTPPRPAPEERTWAGPD